MYRQGMAYQTINLRKIVLNMIYNYALLNEYTNSNPIPALTVPKGAKRTERELPEANAIKTIFENVDQPLGMYFLLAACTGGRRGEILALTKSDIDFKNDLISFNKVCILSNNSVPQIRNGTKSNAGNRTVPILPAIKQTLKEYVKGRESDYLFTYKEQPYTKPPFDKQCAKYKENTGINFTSHQLRHLYATLML